VARVLDAGIAETTEIPAPPAPDRRLRVTASPLKAMGRTTGVLVLVHDPAEATRSVVSYRRLISAVAHELRTPLTAILGHADILGTCDPQQDEALWRRSREFIAGEAERLARLVEDLLTLSRLGLTPLHRRPVNLLAIAEEALSTLFQVAEARTVRLALQSPPSLPRVLGDRDRLHQVFLNLLDNAIKYSPAGGEANVRLASGAGHVKVEVCDNGVGIAPEDLPYVFDPFYRSEGVHDMPGTGLGLTIVRTILDQHGATIDVQSIPGQGTSFHFSLPRAHSSSSLRRAGQSSRSL
jgi:two-component system phosphate regulon sensor histidine kinase PhoR